MEDRCEAARRLDARLRRVDLALSPSTGARVPSSPRATGEEARVLTLGSPQSER